MMRRRPAADAKSDASEIDKTHVTAGAMNGVLDEIAQLADAGGKLRRARGSQQRARSVLCRSPVRWCSVC